MTDLILISTFIVSIIAFVEIVRRREVSASSQDTPDTRTISPAATTREADSHQDIPAILARHSSDDCLSVRLTAGAPSKLGREELLSLRPGAPLWLEHCDYSGIERVKVYSGGFMIGELLLVDAENVIAVMDRYPIHGTYVAENHSTADGNVDMRIVVFYDSPAISTSDSVDAAIDRAMASPYKITVNLPDNTNLFQN